MLSRPLRSAVLLLLLAGLLVPLPATAPTAVATPVSSEPAAHPAHRDYVVAPERPALRRASDSEAHGSSAEGRHAASADHTDRKVTGVSTYDVHVLAVTTPSGAHGLTRAVAREVIARLDTEYARETGGLYRFRFGSYRTAKVDVSSCDLDYWNRTHGATPAPTSGATDSTWVVVAAAPCGYSGLAYLDSPGMHLLPSQFRASGTLKDPGAEVGAQEHQELDVATLAHEMGHNLGLWHARAQEPHSGVAFPGPYTVEYGSHFSVMGSNQSTVRFSASELIDLGVLTKEQLGFVLGEVETWTIAPMSASSGTRAVVVPLGDTHHTVLSYRNGDAYDWPLKYGVAASPDGRATDDLGVHVESETVAQEISDVTTHDDANRTVTARPAGSGEFYAERQAYKAGEAVELPGGVRVEVVQITPAGATVRVRRPADLSAPVFHPADRTSVCTTATITGTRRSPITRTGRTCHAFGTTAKVSLDLRPAMDDTWVARTGVDVNGSTRTRRTWTLDRRRSGQGETSFAGSRFSASFTLPRGTHTVDVWVEDVFGNRKIERSTLTLSADKRSPGVRALTSSAVKRTSLRLGWQAPATPRAPISDYVITRSQWKAGRWTTPRTLKDGVSTQRTVKVSGLARGTSYRFTVAAKNPHGLSPVRTLTVRTAR